MKPMKPADFDRSKARFPLDVTPKIDGWRVRIKDGVALSASGEPLRNPHVQEWAQRNASRLNGLDGEIVVGHAAAPDVVRKTAAVNAKTGKPDFTFHAFDRFDQPEKSYAERRQNVARQVAGVERTRSVPAVRVNSLAELDRVEAKLVGAGFEGAIARRPDAPYKFGRSTVNEAGMLKIKRFSDAEARIVGAKELIRKDGSRGGVLGALEVERGGVRFEVGSGFTAADRAKLWKDRSSLSGQLVKFKHMEAGAKDAPRHPVFLAMRDPADMTEPVKEANPMAKKPLMTRTLANKDLRPAAVTVNRSRLGKLGRSAGALALPIGLGAVALTMLDARRNGASASEVAKDGGLAVADLVTGGAVSGVQTAASGKSSTADVAVGLGRAGLATAQAGSFASYVGVTGTALRVAEGVGAAAMRISLPIALATTAYGAYQGFKKDGTSGAIRGGADALTFGIAGVAYDATRAFLNERAAAMAAKPAEAPAPAARQQVAQSAPKPARGQPQQFKTVNGRQVMNPWFTQPDRMRAFGRAA